VHENAGAKARPKVPPFLISDDRGDHIKQNHRRENGKDAMRECAMLAFGVRQFGKRGIRHHQVIQIWEHITQHHAQQQPFLFGHPVARDSSPYDCVNSILRHVASLG